jgi:uncharacterized protein (DUF305 family)
MKIKYQTSRILLVIVLSASISFAYNPKRNPDPMVTVLEPLKGEQFQVTFLQEMIQHHRGGIDMAKLVSSHSQRPELRQFADKMIPMQQQEIEKMTGWLKEWHNASPKEPANAKSEEKMKTDMSTLQKQRDIAFDKSFIDMMSRHHDSAVEMAKQAQNKSTHQELKEFAAQLAKHQQAEIEQLKGWGKSWFGPI